MHNRPRRGFLKSAVSTLCLAVIVLLTGALASAQVLELGIEQAIALAEEHNLAFRLVRIDWQAARAALERAQIVGDSEMLKQAETAWGKENQHYLEQRENLRSAVQSSYYRLLEKETSVANILSAKERAENQLAVDEKKYEAGLLSSLDIQRAKNSLFDARHSYEMALISLETERLRFNELVGLPFEQEVILTERLLLEFLPFTYDLTVCVELAFELDQGIKAAQENLVEAVEAVLAAQSPFTPRVELEEALAREKKAEITLRQAEQALYFKIRGAYYALADQTYGLTALERQIELERKALQAEKSKYAAGVLSNAQIVAQQEKLAQLEQDYSTALLDYSLARLELLRSMGRAGLGEDNDEN